MSPERIAELRDLYVTQRGCAHGASREEIAELLDTANREAVLREAAEKAERRLSIFRSVTEHPEGVSVHAAMVSSLAELADDLRAALEQKGGRRD